MARPLSESEEATWETVSQLMDRDAYGEALVLLNELLSEERAPIMHAYRGLVHFRLENYGDAVADFNRAIASTPEAANTIFLRGRCLEELERFEDAIADYRRVTRISPETADAHAQLGYCLEMLGRGDEARASYREALKHDPNESLALAGLRELSDNNDSGDA